MKIVEGAFLRHDRGSFWLRFLLSSSLLFFFFWKVDFNSWYQAVTGAKAGYLLAGILLYALAQVVSAAKWRYLAASLGITKDLIPMIRLYFAGMFFNLFLPTNIGGDVVRTVYLDPGPGKLKIAFVSVVADRVSGALCIAALASLVLISGYGRSLPVLLRFGFPLATLALFLFVFFGVPGVLKLPRLRSIFRELTVLWQRPRVGGIALLYSCLFNVILLLIHVCIANSLSLRIPVPYYLVMISMGSLAGFFPSVNGIGTRDGAYIFLLSRVAVDMAHALVFSLLWFLVMAICSLPGSIFYVMMRRQVSISAPGLVESTSPEMIP